MIKHINHQNISVTPFTAAKSWDLYNIQSDDALLLEPLSSSIVISDTLISIDYVDYNSGNPILNRDCDVALEQQDASNIIFYEEGVTGSGYFDPNIDPQNNDGTFKRLVHSQTKLSFYNSYGNPSQIFGVECLDFPLSQTNRSLSDFFRMFSIPRNIFGEKIIPKTVEFYDTSLDDNVSVFDDGYQNLLAGFNLFSKVQEIRYIDNIIMNGTSSYACPVYEEGGEEEIISGSLLGDSSSFNVGFQFGNIDTYIWYDYASVGSTFLSGSLMNVIVSSSVPGDTGSISSITFLSGSIFGVVVTSSVPGDTGSISSITFLSGSIFNTIVELTGSSDTSSISSITLLSGSIFEQLIAIGLQTEHVSLINVGFNNGYIT